MTDNDRIREEIRARATDYLERDASGKGYICPVCKSGTGKKGTGITTKDGVHFTCWAGCFQNVDIIDIIALKEKGIDPSDRQRYPEKLETAAAAVGVQYERSEQKQYKSERKPAPRPTPEEDFEADYTDLYREAMSHVSETDYATRRGLSPATVSHFGIGYLPAWRHPKAPAFVPTSPRLIIPTSKSSYLARDTREQLTDDEAEHAKQKVGTVHLFNLKALSRSTGPVYITEGEIDAMSIYETGGDAVGLGSAGNVKKLLEHLEEHRPTATPLIVALDNDKRGQDAADELEEGLKKLRIKSYRLSPQGEYKDANERLQHDREGLAAYIDRMKDADQLKAADAAERIDRYRKANSAASHLQEFINGIAASVNTPSISTGFDQLDQLLEGGLYPGLYIMGAVSSLGKTTLSLQIADNIAMSGRDVLIVSLEMARAELMAKSISRHTALEIITNGGNMANAKTTRGITDGKRWAKYNQTEKQLIQTAIAQYGEYADHVFIIQGEGDYGVKEIRKAVDQHVQTTGSAPIVVVDYLQIISPYNERYTDKQNTDASVRELRRISRDYNTPVLAISSLNRENYDVKINMAAFKESGAIEYSSDCLIGLQFKGAGEKNFDGDAAAEKSPREVELKLLKQRNGKARGTVQLEYFPMFNLYREAGK